MPDLNADISLFNLNNRGANGSLQTARNTLNQLLTDMNWGNQFTSSSLLIRQTVTPLKSTAQNIDEAIVLRGAHTAAQPADQLAYTTKDGTARSANHLWITDGKANGTIELSAALANNNSSQQIFDIIDTQAEFGTYTSFLYFTRERSDGSSVGLAQPHTLELWLTSGTISSTKLVQSWNQISDANGSRTTAVSAAQAFVAQIKEGIYPVFQSDHRLTQAYNSREIQSSSNYHSHNPTYTLAGGQLLADGRLSSDFGRDRLANLGSISLFVGDGSLPIPGQSREFFIRNDHEIWLHLNSTAERIATIDGTIQAAYDLDNRLVVVTDRGLTAIAVNMSADPITSLLYGNYRALKDLARDIGGEALAKEVIIPEFDTTGWSIKGIRDYDGDGDVDIFWRNNASGQGAFWQMNGLKFEKGLLAGPQANYLDWQVKGFGDFDRDGDQDIFWQNSSGLNVIWEMQGLNFKSGTMLPTTSTMDWFFSGIGNFNGDRNLEILWRNRDGTMVTWEIEGFKLKSGKVLTPNVGNSDTTGWYVQAVADFDNDGDSDILWNNSNTPTMVLWEMQAGQFKAGALLTAVQDFGLNDERTNDGTTYYPQTITMRNPYNYGGQLDINGDGNLDIWWRSPFTARREAWTFKRNSQTILSYAGTLTK
jgi:FG-GAP-like repeat